MFVSTRVGVNSFLSIPIQFQFGAKCELVNFNSFEKKMFNSIHELFNSNSNPVPYHHYFIRVALLKFYSTQLIPVILTGKM